MSLRLEAALRGDLEKVMRQETETVERAVTNGVDNAGGLLQRSIRQDIIASGLGVRLSKTIRKRRYPRGGQSASAASLVTFNAPKIVAAFEEGATASPKSGKYLAIPTDAARGMRRIIKGRKGQRRAPTPEELRGAGFKLRTIPAGRGRRHPLIVTQDVRLTKTGKATRNAKFTRGGRRRKRSFVALFVLVRSVRLRKLLNIDAQARRAERLLPRLILREFRKHDDS